MIFKVTHVGADGRRLRLRVLGTGQRDVADQVERAFGVPWAMAAVRLPTVRPVLAAVRGRLVGRGEMGE